MTQLQLNEQLERENARIRLANITLESENKNLWSAVRAYEDASKAYEQLTNELKLEIARAEREDNLKTQRIIDMDETIKILQARLFKGNVISN